MWYKFTFHLTNFQKTLKNILFTPNLFLIYDKNSTEFRRNFHLFL